MEKEIWKDIPGYEGLYQASNLGNLKSLERIIPHSYLNCMVTRKEKILNYKNDLRDYYDVNLTVNGKRKKFKVHQLIAMAFLNHKPDGHKYVVDHIDNNRLNNNISNIQVITHRENSSKDRRKTSKYTGVCLPKKGNKWVASININKKRFHLGYFIDELEASTAYQKALKNFLENGISPY
jgi:hypothetical protein